jgi:hypothetical protein
MPSATIGRMRCQPEIDMRQGNRSNKEPKKPKKSAVAKPPLPGSAPVPSRVESKTPNKK